MGQNRGPAPPSVRATIEKITKEWADKGKLLEGGWQAYMITSGLAHASDIQKREMRIAWFLGAQHLFSSILLVMDEDREPTEDDMRRMSLVGDELEAFGRSMSD